MYIRIYDEEKDLVDCTQIFVDSFYPIMWPIIESYTENLIMDLLRLIYSMSSYGIVAKVDGKARGMIFGYAPASWHLFPETSAMLYKIGKNIISREYQLSRIAWKHVSQILRHIPSFLAKHKWVSSEILMLGTQKKYRNQCIAKALLERFIEIARENNVEQMNAIGISTYLSVENAPISFYEHHGFTKYDQFKARMFYTAARDKDPRFTMYNMNI